eukprot:gene1405-biopygen6739
MCVEHLLPSRLGILAIGRVYHTLDELPATVAGAAAKGLRNRVGVMFDACSALMKAFEGRRVQGEHAYASKPLPRSGRGSRATSSVRGSQRMGT